MATPSHTLAAGWPPPLATIRFTDTRYTPLPWGNDAAEVPATCARRGASIFI
ncbi:hypothetical protein [Azospirillum sp. TSO22-1]|uniref:hypothetical protein n=1 Tax=Azospirillum sp. TSO22-1 TaxID=716789 RepID=UPI001304F47C|nr:hypothetical protein [Azospirillum sp. TSO22-1]